MSELGTIVVQLLVAPALISVGACLLVELFYDAFGASS